MDNKFNSIDHRIDNIQKFIKNKIVDSMVNFDNKNNEISSDTGDDDIREFIKKKYIDFNTVINELGGKLLYIKSGATGHTFKGINFDSNKPDYAVKVVAYSKKDDYGAMFDIKRPENTELMMIKLLSWFVKNNQSPHIVLPMTTFNTSIKTFVNLSKDNIVKNKRFDNFVSKYNKGEYHDNVSVLISEWANSGDLLDYLKKNYKTMKLKDWRVILFQLLSVLSIIQTKYPGFRHNDLKANNILVNKIGVSSKNKYFLYKINNQKYEVPNSGLQIKIWDFDFACIPGIVENNKVNAEWTNKINISASQNRYYDIHYFFNTLVKKGFFPQFYTEPEIPEKVKSFVKRIVPSHLTKGDNVAERGRLLLNEEYLIPDEILKNDKFFASFRI